MSYRSQSIKKKVNICTVTSLGLTCGNEMHNNTLVLIIEISVLIIVVDSLLMHRFGRGVTGISMASTLIRKIYRVFTAR